MPKIDAPSEITIPPDPVPSIAKAQSNLPGGVSAATWSDVQFWSTRDIFVNDGEVDGRSHVDQPTRMYLGLPGVDLWCSLGSEIYDYDVWHELDDVTKVCPYSTEQPPETWETWGVASNGSHAPVQIDGKWYRSNLYGEAGQRLPASQWYQYIANPSTATSGIVRLLTVEQFQAIQQAANPAP